MFADDIFQVVTKWLTLVAVCARPRERPGGLSRVRPQSAGRPTVALRETQEGPDFPLLHGENVLELLELLSPRGSGESHGDVVFVCAVAPPILSRPPVAGP